MAAQPPVFDPRALLDPRNAHKQPLQAQNAPVTPASHGHESNGQYGTMLEKIHNVELRHDQPAPKRFKALNSPDENEEEARYQLKKPGPGPHAGSGELGQYVKEKQREGDEIRARSGIVSQNFVDLTSDQKNDEDDDVIVVSDTTNREVCLGRIEGARVNAHRIPSPKTAAFSQTQKTWPPLRVTLGRRHGSNTHIIGVADPLGKDFGTIDVRTAGVLAPLMDQTKFNGIRWLARLEPRKREPYEFPGQSCSSHFAIQINLFAPRNMVAGIGKLFSQRSIWLRQPVFSAPGVEVMNPHEPKDYNPRKALLASSSRYGSGSSQVHRTQEEVKRDVSRIFDSLQQTDNLPEMVNPKAVKTELLKHQKQALYFMLDREQDKRGTDVNDEHSMWQKQDGARGTSWYHVITGHSVKEEPEPVLGGILADVMGLGKTLNVLSLVVSTLDEAAAWERLEPPAARFEGDCDLVFNSRATLLICPLSTVSNWEEQMKQHFHDPCKALKYTIYHGTNRPNDPRELRDYDLVITTYPIVAADAQKRSIKRPRVPLAEVNWFRIVLDEAHLIREQSTGQSKAVCALTANRRWAVTGTPVQNRLDDLGALFKFLRIRPFEEPRNFNQFIIAPFKTADVEILPKLRLLVDSITLRRLKDKLDLPGRDERVERLDMTDGERSFYDFFSRESTKNVTQMLKQDKISGKGYAHVLKAILRMRLMCAAGSDLLSDEDWDAAQGFDYNTAIDLEDIETDKAERTPRQAFELYKMLKDTSSNNCARCAVFINAREVIEEESDDEEDEEAPDTFGYIAGCSQLICPACIEDFRAECRPRTGPDNFGYCPICDSYMRMSLFELKQAEYDAEELSQREARKNPRLAKQLGRYSGPHTKTKALMQRLEANAAESEELAKKGQPPVKSVVFSGWTSHLDLVQLALLNSKTKFVRLDGSMTRKARKQALESFSYDDEVTCILISIAAGGLGLNLTAASWVFVMEPQYNPAQEEQAVERVHRLGQQRDVIIIKYIMSDSFEEKMLLLQNRKKALAEMSMDKQSAKKYSNEERAKQKMEELRALFK